ncbi:MAG: heat-inducible transcription repressor HrcA [Anaerolineae bacterium]|nr:heat-inducible transcription repressor HrcA [Anaerolineae bacterium]
MEELTERQKLILTLIIHEYARTATPVGSKGLVDQYRLEMSSATVRNEMASLTERGYLRQPHTSAGRVPTEEGYRFFVGRLLHQTDLPDSTQRMISHQFYQTRRDVEQWMRLAASVLAHQSHAASMITAPHPERARVKHIELISTRGRQVLIVVVMVGGEIHQRLVTLSEPVSQAQLSATADRINQLCQGKDFEDVYSSRSTLPSLEQDVISWVKEEIEHKDTLAAGEIYLDGIANIMSQPEFSGTEDGRRTLRILEERSLLQNVLTRTLMHSSFGGVEVLIGGEGTWEELRQCAIVLSRYGVPGLASGTLGVLGPMRMSYGRTISTVRFMSSLLSDLVSETLVE